MASESAAVLRYAKLTEKALPTTRELPRAAGFDLKSSYTLVILACGNELAKTDLAIRPPERILLSNCTSFWNGTTSTYQYGRWCAG